MPEQHSPIEPATPVVGGEHAERDAEDDGQAQAREGEREGVGRLLANLLEDKTIRANRSAEIAAQEVAKEACVLDRGRIVEPELHPQLGNSLGRGSGVAQHDERRVSR